MSGYEIRSFIDPLLAYIWRHQRQSEEILIVKYWFHYTKQWTAYFLLESKSINVNIQKAIATSIFEWVIENENVIFWQILLKLIGLGTINHNMNFVIDNKSYNKRNIICFFLYYYSSISLFYVIPLNLFYLFQTYVRHHICSQLLRHLFGCFFLLIFSSYFLIIIVFVTHSELVV